MAAEADTKVTATSFDEFTLNEGEARMLRIPSIRHSVIQADKPILVAQVSPTLWVSH